MSGEGTIPLKWRLIVSIIGTAVLLAALRKFDDLFVAIIFFIVIFGAVTVATKLAS
ncbi:MAG: hypothetical protein V3S97_08525 [Candidatus Bathyarchaeia archaeon]